MRQATVLPRAQSDIDDIAAFIAGDSAAAGWRFLTAFRQTCGQLLETPRCGYAFAIPGQTEREIRCWRVRGFRNWLVFYRLTDSGIEVIRVLHGARDIVALLADESIEDEPEGAV